MNVCLNSFKVFGRLILNEGDVSPSRSDPVSTTEAETEGEMADRTRDIDLKEHMVQFFLSKSIQI